MKWCPFDPAAFLEGVIGLDAEERGFYITLISLCYARAPKTDVHDELVVKAMACRPQVWQRVKKSLISKGKVHETDGKLTANRVQTTLQTAAKLISNQSRKGRLSAAKRWGNKDLAVTSRLVKTKTKTKAKVDIDESISTPRASRAGPSRISKNWKPVIGEEDLAEFQRFVDHAKANDKLFADWDAAWRNWKSSPYRNNGGNHRPNYKDKRQEELEDAKQALDESIDRHRAEREVGKSLEADAFGLSEFKRT